MSTKSGGFLSPRKRGSPEPLPGHEHVLVAWRWIEPDGWSGDSETPRLVYRRIVVDDGHDDEVRRELRRLRRLGMYQGLLAGDVLPAEPGATRRGVPLNYDGTDPRLCNAKTRSGRPCRSLALANGRCKWHGGRSTGPRTPEGKRRVTLNLIRANEAKARKRRHG
jgi:hypothetical protein